MTNLSEMNPDSVGSKRVWIDKDPFIPPTNQTTHRHGYWSAKWIHCADVDRPPFVTAYRRCFTLEKRTTLRVHVTADERYDLFVDGQRLGWGPQRGDVQNWFFESYDLQLDAGDHVIVARAWSLGKLSPYAQMSLRGGFLLAAELPFENILNTGMSDWQVKKIQGYEFKANPISWGAGPDFVLDAQQYDWHLECSEDKHWHTAIVGELGASALYFSDFRVASHRLRPAMLPAMLDQNKNVGVVRHIDRPLTEQTWQVRVTPDQHMPEEVGPWNALLQGRGIVVIEPHTTCRVIIDLQNYYCAYPQWTASDGKGSSVRIHWAESLYEQSKDNHEENPKGNRDHIENKYFIGVGDQFKTDGGYHRVFTTLWWRPGRYVELFIRTDDDPLVIENFSLRETRYPLESNSVFSCDDPRLEQVLPIMIRSLQMCTHETYIDCPFYEQMMYPGDTRLQILATYCMTNDNRLPRKAIEILDKSRTHHGLLQSHYPARELHIIPPFSLWWVAMVYDHALWRGGSDFIRQRMVGVRCIIDTFLNGQNAKGLIVSPNGWNFVDWVPIWDKIYGEPPTGKSKISGIINWQFVLVLTMVCQLERWMGEEELASRTQRLAQHLADQLVGHFWDEQRGLLSDDMEKKHFSEHTQCMALLSSLVPQSIRPQLTHSLLNDPDLARTTIYFTHYLFETYRLLGRIDSLFERLGLWFDLDRLGFKTTFETPGNTRSDCHGWGAHPIYHCYATILGIRPTSFGFQSVEISPQLGHLNMASGTLIHPRGRININLHRKGKMIVGAIHLPKGLAGKFILTDHQQELADGETTFEIENRE